MKVGGNRNYGYGKSLAWAGKNALKDRYGKGHFATQAAHAARWSKFAEFAKSEGIRDARELTRDTIRNYAASLAGSIEANAVSVRYAQNLVSTVNVVLETMRGDRQLRISPPESLGNDRHSRSGSPSPRPSTRGQADRATRSTRACARRHDRLAGARVGLRFREASLLVARAAYSPGVAAN